MRGVSDTPTELELHVASQYSSFWPSCVTVLEIAANLPIVSSSPSDGISLPSKPSKFVEVSK